MLLGRTSDAESRPTDACGHEYLGWAAGRTLPGEQAETVRRRPRDVASEPAAGTSDASGLRAQGRLGACSAGSAPERRAAKRRHSRFDGHPHSPNRSPFALPPARSSCNPPPPKRRDARVGRRGARVGSAARPQLTWILQVFPSCGDRGRRRGASAAHGGGRADDECARPRVGGGGARLRTRPRDGGGGARLRTRPRAGGGVDPRAKHRDRERKKVPRGPCRQPRGTGVACVCRRIRRAPRT